MCTFFELFVSLLWILRFLIEVRTHPDFVEVHYRRAQCQWGNRSLLYKNETVLQIQRQEKSSETYPRLLQYWLIRIEVSSFGRKNQRSREHRQSRRNNVSHFKSKFKYYLLIDIFIMYLGILSMMNVQSFASKWNNQTNLMSNSMPCWRKVYSKRNA